MQIEKKPFGISRKGDPVSLFSIRNNAGMTAVVSDFGAILVQLLVPCQGGEMRDVVLGYDTLPEYEKGGFFGATVGRHANRIAGASFVLDGVRYTLPDNDGGCNLHSDFHNGFHKQFWRAEQLADGIAFSRVSPDGECGFPGNLKVRVSYQLREDNALVISCEGQSDRKTLINLTNHSFFNLAGHNAGRIPEHRIRILSDSFLEIGPGRLPTGNTLSVAGTPMDFREMQSIGSRIDQDWEQLRYADGYDHCYITGATPGMSRVIALAEAPDRSCRMEVRTDLPGVQFYTANFLPAQHGKNWACYGRRSGFCLETQYYPDSIHHPDFPQCIFSPGDTYHSETVFRFL